MDFEAMKARLDRLNEEFDAIDEHEDAVQTALEGSDGPFVGRPMAKLVAAAAHLGAIEQSDLQSLSGADEKEWARKVRGDLVDILDAAAGDYPEAEELEDYAMIENFLDWSDDIAGRSWRKSSEKYRQARRKLAGVVHELEGMDLDARFDRLIPFFDYMEFTILMQDLRGSEERFVARYLRRLRAVLEEMHEHADWARQDATEMVIHIDDRLEEMES